MENENNSEQRRIDGEAQAVEQDFGDCAEIYAEVRAKAAEIRGDPDAADRWQLVRENLESEGGDAGQ